MPILLQLYLLFPLLFYGLKKLNIRNFLLLSLLIKIFSSAVIISGSLLAFQKIIGFGYGGLAPGGIALTRLFEFCFGMAIAKLFVKQEYSLHLFTQFRQPKFIILGFLLEFFGIFLSLKYANLIWQNQFIPVGLLISDALIGIGIFILSLNFIFLIFNLLQKIKTSWLAQISNGTYEAYLIHGCMLGYFNSLLILPIIRTVNLTNNYLITCLLYLIFLLIFSILNLALGCYLLDFKFYLLKKLQFFSKT